MGNPSPLEVGGLFSTTTEFLYTMMEFLFTMKELQDTMMESLRSTVYNGTGFDGFLKCGSRFSLRWNIAKNTNYIKKFFTQKQSKIKFSTKKQWKHNSISPSSGARGLQRLAFPFQCLIFQKQQINIIFYSMPGRACAVNIPILCHHFVTYQP